MAGKHHGNGMDQSKGIRRKEKEKKKQSITLFVVGISQRSEQYALSSWADFLTSALGSNTWIRFCMKDQCVSKNRSKFDSALDSCSNGHV